MEEKRQLFASVVDLRAAGVHRRRCWQLRPPKRPNPNDHEASLPCGWQWRPFSCGLGTMASTTTMTEVQLRDVVTDLITAIVGGDLSNNDFTTPELALGPLPLHPALAVCSETQTAR